VTGCTLPSADADPEKTDRRHHGVVTTTNNNKAFRQKLNCQKETGLAPVSSKTEGNQSLDYSIFIVCRLALSLFGKVSSSRPSLNTALALLSSTEAGRVMVRRKLPLMISCR